MATYQLLLVASLVATFCVMPSLQSCARPVVPSPVILTPDLSNYTPWAVVMFSCPSGYSQSSGSDYSYCFSGSPDYWYPDISTAITCVSGTETSSIIYDVTVLQDMGLMLVADDDGEIYVSDVTGTLSFHHIPLSISAVPVALDYDPNTDMVYWTEVSAGSINRANLDGSNQQTIASTDVSVPDGLALDTVQNKVYWTDTGSNRIEMANLDGSGRQAIIYTGLDEPRAILIHQGTRKVYWTDWGVTAKIEKSNLDGSNKEVIVQTGLMWPNGIAFSSDGSTLYWCDGGLDRIESVDLSGNNRRTLLSTSSIHPFDLVVKDNIIMWSDWTYRALGYSDDDGATYNFVYASVFTRPMGMHFYPGTYIATTMEEHELTVSTVTVREDITTTTEPQQTTTAFVTPIADAHLICDDTSMTLIMERSLLENHGDASDVHFEDQSCVGYDHDSERIAISTRYDRCSTEQEQTNDHITFSNIVTYFKPTSINGSVITRDFRLHIPVKCLLKRDRILGTSYKPKLGVVSFTEVGFGSFNLSLDRFTDDTFSQPADQSAFVFLGEPLYFGVNLAAVTDLTLLIMSCWATPRVYQTDQPQYHFIEEGCAEDPTVHFHNGLGTMFMGFDIDAFAFIGEYDEVYVHCEILVCDNDDPSSRCAQGCLSRAKRSVASSGSRSKPHTISNGPLSSHSDNQQSGSSDDSWITNPIKMAAIGTFGFCLAFIGLVVYMKVVRRPQTRGYRRVDRECMDE